MEDSRNAAISQDLMHVNRIRVETALSRFPIHRLAKRDAVTIDLQHAGANGEPDFKWEVTYNQKHGQPGPLAYKVDTLIVNRRIDEAGRPLPDVIRLGSLTELCAALEIADSGENRSNLKKALHQNASAYITAKIRYRTKTGKERWGEIGYTRYSVVFTGETLPDGSQADAVYIVPNPGHRDLLNQVEVRPLDYDYLTQLSPGAQRFYELLSFQMYGALAGGRQRARMLYSQYCLHAPQSRYVEFDRMKKQMFKLHQPHREADYIGKVDYEPTTDGQGRLDWAMFYTPGAKAVAEYQAFARRHVGVPLPAPLPTLPNATQDDPLLAELTRRGVAEKKGRELLAGVKAGQEVLDQLEYVDSLVAGDRQGRLVNPPGLYVAYVRDNVAPPPGFVTSRKRRIASEDRATKKGELERQARLRAEYEAYRTETTCRFIRGELPAEQYAAIFARHIAANRSMFPKMPKDELEALTEGTVRSELKDSGQVVFDTFQQYSARILADAAPAGT